MRRIVLTRHEIQVIAFVLAAFVLGIVAKTYREHHPNPQPPAEAKAVSKARATSTPRRGTR